MSDSKRSNSSVEGLEREKLEEAEYQDVLRKSKALSLQNEDKPITEVPRRRAGMHGLSERQTDQDDTCFTLEEAKEEGLDDLKLCDLLDGRGPPNFNENNFSAYTVGKLRGVLRLGWRELNHIIMDSLYQSVEEAQELNIDVDEDSLESLRDKAFHEKNEKMYMSEINIITKHDALELMKRLRCELAWTKDNRDWLIEFVDMAQELNENGTPHKLKFQFDARKMDIELMENRERERVLCGDINEDSAEGGAGSPKKKRRHQAKQDGSNEDDAMEDTASESEEADDESSDAEEL